MAKLKKYLEIFQGFKINEDDHIIRDENVPFGKLNVSKKNNLDKIREENAKKNTGLTPDKEKELARLREYYAKKHDGVLENEEIPSEDYEPNEEDIRLAGKTLDDLVDGEEEQEDPEITGKVDTSKVKEGGDGYTESDLEADMENLTSLIRQLFKNTSIEAEVIYDGLDIDIYVFLHRREKMKQMLKVFDSVMKLKKDILPQYDSTVELYESKEKWPILQFRFEYESEVVSTPVKKEEPKALPPASQVKQGNLFVEENPDDLATRGDSDSRLPF